MVSAAAEDLLPRAASACACGGGCPRCAAPAPLGFIQRQAAPDAQAPAASGASGAQQGDRPTPQDDSDESSGESCGAGEIGGQVYMCCYANAPAGHRCWKVRADTFDGCYAKTRDYELCLGKSNFAACRCFGDKYCHCGGLV